jgi:CNT family concentrative nucleoside transporter
MLKFFSLMGLFVFIALAWLLSVNRKEITWRPVIWGVALQFIFGLVVLHPSMQDIFFSAVNGGVKQLLAFSEEAATFVFGSMEAHDVTRVNLKTGEKSTGLVIGSVSP